MEFVYGGGPDCSHQSAQYQVGRLAPRTLSSKSPPDGRMEQSSGVAEARWLGFDCVQEQLYSQHSRGPATTSGVPIVTPCHPERGGSTMVRIECEHGS